MPPLRKEDIMVRNVKTFTGHDGQGFNATLYVRGKRTADVVSLADGGEFEYTWHLPEGKRRHFGGELERELKAYAAALPGVECPELKRTLPQSLDMVVEDLVNDVLEERKYRRECRTKTLFTIKGDPDHLWQVARPYTPDLAVKLRAKHGDALQEIINERYLVKTPTLGAAEDEQDVDSPRP